LATENKPEKFKIKNILLIVLGLVFVMVLTTVIAYTVAKNIAAKPSPLSMENNKSYTTYVAGEYLTNLSDKGYIKLSMVYLLSNKNVEKELEQKEYEIQDKVYSILRSKTFSSVKDSKGMDELRTQIKDEANKILSSGRIEDVFFTSIIVN